MASSRPRRRRKSIPTNFIADEFAAFHAAEDAKRATKRLKLEEETYDINFIVDRRGAKGTLEYKVRWVGYGAKDDTWQPVSTLGNAGKKVEAFEDKRTGTKAATPKKKTNGKKASKKKTPARKPRAPKRKHNMIVGYWSIRGLGAPLRMMCSYAGAEYEAILFDAKPTQDSFDTDEWFKGSKPDLKEKNALMNLPYVLDGDIVVAQTNACFAHVGRTLGLYGSNDEETRWVEQCLCECMDLRNAAVGIFYGGDFSTNEAALGHLNGTVKDTYAKFEAWLDQRKTTYTAGKKPTAADFHIWEMLDQHEVLAKHISAPSPLASSKRLAKLYAAFRKLPKLQAYFDGPLHKLPINNKMAKFGAEGVINGRAYPYTGPPPGVKVDKASDAPLAQAPPPPPVAAEAPAAAAVPAEVAAAKQAEKEPVAAAAAVEANVEAELEAAKAAKEATDAAAVKAHLKAAAAIVEAEAARQTELEAAEAAAAAAAASAKQAGEPVAVASVGMGAADATSPLEAAMGVAERKW